MASKDFDLYCLKDIGPHVCFFTFHIYDDLFRIILCLCVYVNVMVFFIGLCKSGLAKVQQRTVEVGGGALDFALVKKLM